MESLALLAALIVLVIYASAIIAFALSWIKHRVAKVITIIFAALGILSGAWILATLFEGNGIFIGSIPILVSVFAIWNTVRRSKPTKL